MEGTGQELTLEAFLTDFPQVISISLLIFFCVDEATDGVCKGSNLKQPKY
jgi:hypothetical protein